MRKSHSCEADVKQDVKELLKRHGAWYFMPSMNGYGRSGIPDFIFCLNGVFGVIETKYGRNKPTHHQERELESIDDRGGFTIVVNEKNLDILETHLKSMSETTPWTEE